MVEPMAQIGGPVQTLAVQDSYAYIGAGSNLIVLNISDPAHPIPMGYVGLPELVNDIAVAGSYAYVSAGDLWVVDVHNLNLPYVAGHASMRVSKIAVAGNYLYATYAEGWNGGLRILDVSNPTVPRELFRYSEWFLIPGKVTLFRNYAYVEDTFGKKTLILDISNPALPRKMGTVTPPPNRVDVVVGNYAYGAVGSSIDHTGMLVVMDVSNPSAPQVIRTLNLPEFFPRSLAVVGNYAYIVGDTGGWGMPSSGRLQIIEVSNPQDPRQVVSSTIPGGAMDLAASGNYIYITDEANGLRAFDIRTPESPREIGYFAMPGWITHAVADGSYIYGIGGSRPQKLWIINAQNPAPHRLAGYYNLDSDEEVRDLAAAGGYVYLLRNRLEIIDARNPTAPHRVFRSSESYSGIDVAGNYLYAGNYMGLQIIDVSNPSAPQRIGSVSLPASPSDVIVAGNYAYAYGGGKLWIIDVRDPAHPYAVGSYQPPEAPGFIEDTEAAYDAANDKVYMLYPGRTSPDEIVYKLGIIEASQPNAPREVGSYILRPNWEAVGVKVDNTHAYLLSAKCSFASLEPDTSVLEVLEVSNPTAPRRTGSYSIPGCAQGVAKEGPFLYVTRLRDALSILRIRELNYSAYLPLVLRNR